jgi:hypothetical protein
MTKKKCDEDPAKADPSKKYRCKKCSNASNKKDKLCKPSKAESEKD